MLLRIPLVSILDKERGLLEKSTTWAYPDADAPMIDSATTKLIRYKGHEYATIIGFVKVSEKAIP